jgi:molybdenum cofactor synthesis domain-containing protein
MRVAILTVGDEILSGDTESANATWLASWLTDAGATVARILTLPDDRETIRTTVETWHAPIDAAVVTGGLGGTHDLDLDVDAWVTLPAGSRPLLNPERLCPGCVVENVYAAAGVRDRFDVTVGSSPDTGARNRIELAGTDPAAVDAAADRLRDRIETVAAP